MSLSKDFKTTCPKQQPFQNDPSNPLKFREPGSDILRPGSLKKYNVMGAHMIDANDRTLLLKLEE